MNQLCDEELLFIFEFLINKQEQFSPILLNTCKRWNQIIKNDQNLYHNHIKLLKKGEVWFGKMACFPSIVNWIVKYKVCRFFWSDLPYIGSLFLTDQRKSCNQIKKLYKNDPRSNEIRKQSLLRCIKEAIYLNMKPKLIFKLFNFFDIDDQRLKFRKLYQWATLSGNESILGIVDSNSQIDFKGWQLRMTLEAAIIKTISAKTIFNVFIPNVVERLNNLISENWSDYILQTITSFDLLAISFKVIQRADIKLLNWLINKTRFRWKIEHSHESLRCWNTDFVVSLLNSPNHFFCFDQFSWIILIQENNLIGLKVLFNHPFMDQFKRMLWKKRTWWNALLQKHHDCFQWMLSQNLDSFSQLKPMTGVLKIKNIHTLQILEKHHPLWFELNIIRPGSLQCLFVNQSCFRIPLTEYERLVKIYDGSNFDQCSQIALSLAIVFNGIHSKLCLEMIINSYQRIPKKVVDFLSELSPQENPFIRTILGECLKLAKSKSHFNWKHTQRLSYLLQQT